jgi:hypothetical protein
MPSAEKRKLRVFRGSENNRSNGPARDKKPQLTRTAPTMDTAPTAARTELKTTGDLGTRRRAF